MSEIIASSVNGPNNTTTATNKRKRRPSFDEVDIENQRPPSKKIYSSSGEDLDSGSDIENDGIDLDLYTIGSSPPIQHNARQRIDRQIRTIRNSAGTTTTTVAVAVAATSATTTIQRSSAATSNPIVHNNNNNHSDSNKNSFNNNDRDRDSNCRNGNNSNSNIGGNGQSATTTTLTPINHNNNEAIHVTEMTPQSLKKSSEPWIKCTKCFSKTDAARICPLPLLSWADAKDVWHNMCEKDKKTAIDRSPKMLTKHQGLQPRMRAILLDWLNEVCEVYKLHRETYYLALDYLDRYLSTDVSISKTFLQLIGITCLFIAAKVEEIYPPKLSEFAYVTDGACSEDDIIKQELIILSALKWQTNPITIIGWLGIYMQLQVSNRLPKTNEETPHKPILKESMAQQTPTSQSAEKSTSTTTTASTTTAKEVDDGFVFPQFSGFEYAHTAQLLDLCTLDVGIANFPYSVIAAAAISHTFNKKIAVKLSGLEWATIAPCYRWMEPYFHVILQQPKLHLQERNEQIEAKLGVNSVCPNIVTDDSHIIQMHTTSMDMFDQASLYREQCLQEASPAPMRTNIDHVCPPEGLLTPPDSSRKFPDTHPDLIYK